MFDLIGDIHGCRSELTSLLRALGWTVDGDVATPPPGRRAVLLGDLVDRGPDIAGVLRLVMRAVESGHALCVVGNHEDKLAKALSGRAVTVSHGLAASLEQLALQTPEFTMHVRAFIAGLPTHLVLDDGRLIAAHAGFKPELLDASPKKVRAFALYGDTTGEIDALGYPVRRDWAQEYRGDAAIVYGHTPIKDPAWVNGTICLDTGCVFGGRLTALRWPERELVSVPAERAWYVRPAP